AHPDCEVADLERADAVYACGPQHVEAADRLRDDALAFLFRERLEGLVLEPLHRAAFVVIAHPALASGVTAGRRVFQGRAVRRRRQRGLAEREGFHPPATGGMNTMVSPWRRFARQSLNSEFNATLSCVGASLKGCRERSSSYSSAGVPAAVSSVSSLQPACSRRMAKYCTRTVFTGR